MIVAGLIEDADEARIVNQVMKLSSLGSRMRELYSLETSKVELMLEIKEEILDVSNKKM